MNEGNNNNNNNKIITRVNRATGQNNEQRCGNNNFVLFKCWIDGKRKKNNIFFSLFINHFGWWILLFTSIHFIILINTLVQKYCKIRMVEIILVFLFVYLAFFSTNVCPCPCTLTFCKHWKIVKQHLFNICVEHPMYICAWAHALAKYIRRTWSLFWADTFHLNSANNITYNHHIDRLIAHWNLAEILLCIVI